MDFLIKDINYAGLKKAFPIPASEYRPVPFLHLDGDISDGDNISALFAAYKKSGYGGAALLPLAETKPAYGTDEYYSAYGNLLEKAKKNGFQIVYYDDIDFETGWAGGELAEKYPEALARELRRKEYACTEKEKSRFKLCKDGETLSVVAVEEKYLEVVDLRSFVVTEGEDNYVIWDTPNGNWTITQYYCVTPKDERFVNYLDYDCCRTFINLSYKRFADRFEEYIGNTVTMTFYDDIQFRTANRRMWDEKFNQVFEEKYGFDPAPFYPVLFGEIDKDTEHYRSLFMTCRAEMLADGFFRAVSDFAKTHGLINTGHVVEPKITAAPWLYGDGMLYQKFSGACGLDLVHDYMYGFNGLKLTSSSAYNFDRELVCCEIYSGYSSLDRDALYREALNAFVRGANFLMPSTLWLSGEASVAYEVSHRNPEFRDMLREFLDFTSRCQTLLRGGRHISDIALLYPIYSLASQTTLYEAPTSEFEFARVPSNADFMNVINTVMNYCGHDLTVLHPSVFNDKCHTDDGVLYLANEINSEQYKILILPGASQISIYSLRLAKKFFDEGGKIIATAELPYKAFEFNPEKRDADGSFYDKEAVSIIRHIFGISPGENTTFETYFINKNENGGEAYFIPASNTAADGTDLIEPHTLELILENMKIAWDVKIEDMPRVTNTGILNLVLPSYRSISGKMGVGGVFNYLHRHFSNCDAYFFANSTNKDYKGKVMLRGHFAAVEEWNPHNGKIKKLPAEFVEDKGQKYTRVPLESVSGSGTFIVARTEAPIFGF